MLQAQNIANPKIYIVNLIAFFQTILSNILISGYLSPNDPPPTFFWTDLSTLGLLLSLLRLFLDFAAISILEM